MRYFLFALCALFTSCSHEGSAPSDNLTSASAAEENGWVSSGGDLFKTDKNPWFLFNTKKVKACLEFDNETFSVTKSQAHQAVLEGLAYWKAQFEKSSSKASDAPGITEIATQEFIFGDCDDETDVRLVFGSKFLSSTERAFLSQGAFKLGVLVRTHYDTEQMRAKGLLYITGDRDPEFLKNNPHLADRGLWTYKLNLQATLVHELGHIFGVRHQDHPIMSEAFTDRLVSNPVGFQSSYLESIPNILAQPKSSLNCHFDKKSLEWFGIKGGQFEERGLLAGLSTNLCVEITKKEFAEGRDRYVLKLIDKKSNSLDVLGIMEEASSPEVSWPNDFEMMGGPVVYLTEDQKIFAPEKLITTMLGDDGTSQQVTLPYLQSAKPYSYSLTAKISFADGREETVLLHTSPEGFKLTASVAGEPRIVFLPARLSLF